MSDDVRRLAAQVHAGDVQAAQRLHQLWVRRGEDAAAGVADLLAQAIADDAPARFGMLTVAFAAPAAAAERLATLWSADDTERLETAMRVFGVVCGQTERAAIEHGLDRVAQASIVPPPPTLPLTALLCAAIDEDGIGWSHLVVESRALVALAVVRRVRRVVVLGIGSCDAAGASPGQVWRGLNPWRAGSESLARRCATWALAAQPDRVLLPWVERTSSVDGATASKRAERDPLDVLLDDAPSSALFSKIVRHIEALDPEPARDAVARATRALADWRPALRCGGSHWMGALHAARRRGGHGLGLRLATRLEIAGGPPRPERVDTLLDSGHVATLRELRATTLAAAQVERLIAHAAWTHMERATLEVHEDPDVADVLQSLAERQPDFLARIRQLAINVTRVFVRSDGPWLELKLAQQVGRALCNPLTLAQLLTACDQLRELHLADDAVRAFIRASRVHTVDQIRHLRLDASRGEAVDALRARTWPGLHRLELTALSQMSELARLAHHTGLAAVRELRLESRSGVDIDSLVGSPLLDRLHRVELPWIHANEALLRFLNAPELAGLRVLELPLGRSQMEVIDWFMAEPRFPRLTRLRVHVRGRLGWQIYRQLREVDHLRGIIA